MDDRHHIQRYILGVLISAKVARFRDLRPPRVDSNAFSYHLKVLQRDGIVSKREEGYGLSPIGLAYIDRLGGADVKIRQQPKIMTLTLIFNKKKEMLLVKRNRQPMIDLLTAPSSKLYYDECLEDAARREVLGQVGCELDSMSHIGAVYVSIYHQGGTLMKTLFHVFYALADSDMALQGSGARWAVMNQQDKASIAPATRRAYELFETRQSESLFFDEYSEELVI